MTIEEAKNKISKEFIDKYYQWIDDTNNMDEKEYGKKYGYGKPAQDVKDNLTSVTKFQTYFWCGRYLPSWEREGYDRKIIYDLHKENFLSLEYSSSWNARQTGKEYFYYLNQNMAKNIWRKMHK